MTALKSGTNKRTSRLPRAGTAALIVAWVVVIFVLEPVELVMFSKAEIGTRAAVLAGMFWALPPFGLTQEYGNGAEANPL